MKNKKINEEHERFEVQVWSAFNNKFVPRAKDAIHAKIESAIEIVNRLQILPWQIMGLSTKHKIWHSVKSGKPQEI